jgi:hypothetical protein
MGKSPGVFGDQDGDVLLPVPHAGRAGYGGTELGGGGILTRKMQIISSPLPSERKFPTSALLRFP